MEASTTFNPNLKLPIIQVFVLGIILSLIFWAYLGFSLIFIGFLTVYAICSFFFLISKLMIKYEIGEDFLTKRNSLSKAERTFLFTEISHYDIEKGVAFQCKNGSVYLMDNANAVALLVKKLEQFGIKRAIVNRHNRSYIKS